MHAPPVRVDRHSAGLAVLRMEGLRGNAIDGEWLDAFDRALDEVADARALVVTGTDKFFGVGLNLVDLPLLDRREMDAFTQTFHDLFLRFFTLEKPVVAAVRGHAVAGGALLALACDWRVVADEARFGIRDRDVDVGVPYPVAAVEIVRAALPPPEFPEALYGAGFLGGDAAVRRGWAHERAPAGDVLAHALEKARQYSTRAPESFAATKRLARAPYAERARAEWAAGRDPFVDVWFSEGAQERLARARERLLQRPIHKGE